MLQQQWTLGVTFIFRIRILQYFASIIFYSSLENCIRYHRNEYKTNTKQIQNTLKKQTKLIFCDKTAFYCLHFHVHPDRKSKFTNYMVTDIGYTFQKLSWKTACVYNFGSVIQKSM